MELRTITHQAIFWSPRYLPDEASDTGTLVVAVLDRATDHTGREWMIPSYRATRVAVSRRELVPLDETVAIYEDKHPLIQQAASTGVDIIAGGYVFPDWAFVDA